MQQFTDPITAELLGHLDAEYAVCPRPLSDAYMTLAIQIAQMPPSFARTSAIRHLQESKDWAARASYVVTTVTIVPTEPDQDIAFVAEEPVKP